ncbi:MAG: hypothetical protein J6C84_10670 [Lachnospiraceae bacterium]|nr:hypothetical protein [Lachnospiraceae bacterium]
MKKFQKFVSLLSAAALLAMLPGSNTLTASAAEPTTFCVSYDEGDDAWYYQRDTSEYNPNIEVKEAFQLKDVIKDGDIVVVVGISDDTGLDLDLSNVRLSNLTIAQAATVVVRTKGVDECYVTTDSVAAITGDVSRAYVYNEGSVTFNSNVSYLEIIGTNDVHANIYVHGTVSHVKAVDEASIVCYEYYDFAKGKLEISDGSVQTDEAYYSKTPSASSTQNTAPATQDSQSSAPAPGNTSGAYDSVPKTGEAFPAYLVLIAIAAVCLAGRSVCKRA